MTESYGSNAGFTAYHTARGNDITAFTDPIITIARLRGSEWLDATQRVNFEGSKIAASQEREWPRSGVVDYYGNVVATDSVPTAIENASYEAALRYETLVSDATPQPYKRVSIDGALAVEFGDQSASGIQLQIPIIAQILSALFGPSYSTGAVTSSAVRA